MTEPARLTPTEIAEVADLLSDMRDYSRYDAPETAHRLALRFGPRILAAASRDAAVAEIVADYEKQIAFLEAGIRVLKDPLDWLAEHTNYELSYKSFDDDPCWQVHRVNGGRNDREWTLIGEGETPRAALEAAGCGRDRARER